jgi:asparaginyl-tRNA synthetase
MQKADEIITIAEPHQPKKYVEERFIKKPVPNFLVGEILRLEHVMKQHEQYIDKTGIVAGWARTMRDAEKKTLVFIELTDGSCFQTLQVVVSNTLPNFEEIMKCDVATSFRIKGTFIKSPAKGQAIEMQVNNEANHYVKILGKNHNTKEYPLSKKGHTKEFLREIAHLRPRTKFIGSIARIRNALAFATHIYFQNRGFFYVHTPIITASDCEGAGEMFQVTTVLPDHDKSIKETKLVPNKEVVDYTHDFFKKPAFLTVSGQLAVENFCCALSNVYTFGPTFRAERSNTIRHLAEFWMIEPEMAFADIFDDMEVAEGYLKFCLQYVLENNMDELVYLEAEANRVAKEDWKKEQEEAKKNKKKDDKIVEKPAPAETKTIENLKHVLATPFKRMTYTEIIEALLKEEADGKVKFENKLFWGVDLNSEHERYVCEKMVKGPVIAYNYPRDIKAFYMRQNEDGKTVASMDILVPLVGEIIGGSQREERLDVLDKRIEDLKLNKEAYWWYRDLRKYGSVPHCGFGLGFERLIMMVSGVENIRDVIPYPRTPGHAEF